MLTQRGEPWSLRDCGLAAAALSLDDVEFESGLPMNC